MLIALVEDDDHCLIPSLARSTLFPLIGQLRTVHGKVSEMTKMLVIHPRRDRAKRG
jgi:transposase